MSSSTLESLFIIPANDQRKTFDEDEKLPNLPLPDLSHTLNRYLDSVKPLVTLEEYDKTKEIVKSFEQGIGQVLQEKLKLKAAKERNWIEKWWEDVAYLQVRLPLLISCIMNGVTPKNLLPGTNGTEDDQIKHASFSGYHMINFWNILRNEKLLPGQTADKKTNFSMSQYKRLFNTARIPGDEKDHLVSYFKTVSEGPCPTTVIIICRGRLFCMNVIDEKGNILSPGGWEEGLRKILIICNEPSESLPVGILTCDSRSNWSKNRRHLEELSQKNLEMLNLIDRSLFVLILDDDCPETDSDVANLNINGNLMNRWTDKSISLIFYKNGRSGSLCDHTAFDGIVAIACLYFVVIAAGEDISSLKNNSVGNAEEKAPKIEELKFHIDETLLKEIDRLESETSKYGKEILMTKHTFDDYGKLEIQSMRYHPDSFVQMCLQLAYVRLHGKPAPCYETATTRKFYNGRTETLRSCTTECLEWVASMLDDNRDNEERKILLEKAVKRHDELMSEARENKGCDRHLFGLYCMALEEGLKIPAIFLDPSYFKSGGGGNFILSTSCIGYTPLGGGVAPMCENGYGIFYSIIPNSIYFTISSNKRSKETDPTKYFESVKNSLHSMREVCLLASKKSSKL